MDGQDLCNSGGTVHLEKPGDIIAFPEGKKEQTSPDSLVITKNKFKGVTTNDN